MTERPIQPVSPLPADARLDAAEAARLATSAGAAIRMLADGEANAAALRAVLPNNGSDGQPGVAPGAIQAGVAFETELRGAVGRVMGRDTAPESLRAAVLAAMQAETLQITTNAPTTNAPTAPPATATATNHDHDEHGSAPLSMRGATRSRSFWNRAAGWMAMAAVLALAGLGVFGGLRAMNAGDGFSPEFRQNLISYVAQEHDSSDPDCEQATAKFSARCRGKSEAMMQDVLGTVPAALLDRIEALGERGYRFVGLGRCGLPGEGASVHVLLVTPDEQRASLFVQVRSSEASIRSTCRYTREGCCKAGGKMMVWRGEDFVYYLYSTSDKAHQEVARIFEVPAENRAL